MSGPLPPELRALIESGPQTYLSTTNADGSPHVTMIWIGLDGDDVISTHMRFNAKLRNLERDPRAALAFAPPQVPGDWVEPHVVLHVTASIGPETTTGPLLSRLAEAYVGPGAVFPNPEQTGFVVRYAIDRIAGIGPWVPQG